MTTFLALFVLLQMAAVAALCVQREPDFRPGMSKVVRALQTLLNTPSVPAAEI